MTNVMIRSLSASCMFHSVAIVFWLWRISSTMCQNHYYFDYWNNTITHHPIHGVKLRRSWPKINCQRWTHVWF